MNVNKRFLSLISRFQIHSREQQSSVSALVIATCMLADTLIERKHQRVPQHRFVYYFGIYNLE